MSYYYKKLTKINKKNKNRTNNSHKRISIKVNNKLKL